MPSTPRRFLNTSVKTITSSAPGAWFFARTAHHLDRWTLKLSRGRTTLASLLTGLPIITLTTMGAKTGQQRSVPVVAVPDGERFIVIPSNWGQQRYPGWYHNLRAHPEATVTCNGISREYSAREATPDERARYWQQAVALYPGYNAYERRAGGRTIPVFILTPKA